MKLIGINPDTRELRWPIGAAYVARFRMRDANGAPLSLDGRVLAMSIHAGRRVISLAPGVAGSDADGDFVTFAFAREVSATTARSCQWEIAELFADGKQPLLEGRVYFAPAAPAAPGGAQPDESFDAVDWTAAGDTIVAVLTGAPGRDGTDGTDGEPGAGELVDGVAYFGEMAAAEDGSQDRHWETYPAVPPDTSKFPAWLYTAKSAIKSIAAWFAFSDTNKGLYFSFVRSRGNGEPGTPGYYKASQPNDRLVIFAFYGSSGANAAHAGYLKVLAAEAGVNNELASVISLSTAGSRTNGNGLVINPWAQMIVPGPNMPEPLPYDEAAGKPTEYGGISVVGPGSADGAQERVLSGTLPAVPLPGTRNYDGRFWGVDSAGRHQRYLLQAPLVLTLVQAIAQGVATMRFGVDWIEITLTMTADLVLDPANVGLVARVNIAAPADGTPAPLPVMVGATASASNFDAAQPAFTFARTTNRFVVQASGTLKAGTTYILGFGFRLP